MAATNLTELNPAYPARKRINLIGRSFGRLAVQSYVGQRRYTGRTTYYWKCLCTCGNEKIIEEGNLQSGRQLSCGCLLSERRGQGSVTHGKSKTKEYKIWLGIRKRCHCPTDKKFHRYGGRGIRLCQGYGNFAVFLSDVGAIPSEDHQIDRIDNNGNYSCGKCDECIKNNWSANLRWATRKEQCRNRSTSAYCTWRGETLTLAEWGERLKIKPSILSRRLCKGWTVEDALSIPKHAIGHRRPKS